MGEGTVPLTPENAISSHFAAQKELRPASCDLKWWHEDVVERAEVRYIRGRVRFLNGGPYRSSGFFASVVVIWRNYVTNSHA